MLRRLGKRPRLPVGIILSDDDPGPALPREAGGIVGAIVCDNDHPAGCAWDFRLTRVCFALSASLCAGMSTVGVALMTGPPRGVPGWHCPGLMVMVRGRSGAAWSLPVIELTCRPPVAAAFAARCKPVAACRSHVGVRKLSQHG